MAEPAAKPLSIERLRSAFARMLDPGEQPAAAPEPDGVTPEGVVEALLFAGRGDNQPLTAETLAGLMRDVSPDEVHEIADRLEAGYRRDGAACGVERSEAGYRLGVAPEHQAVAQRMQGRVRPTRLSQEAVETLSVVAYRQPIAAEQLDAIRAAPSQAPLKQLVRAGLVEIVAPTEEGGSSTYKTTDRLLRTLGIAGLGQLPRLAELDD